MTQTMGTNANNDIYVAQNGNVAFFTGQDAVAGACKSTSRASLGEEVLSLNSGLPFFQAVFVGSPNLAIFENYLRNALLAVDGVIAVRQITTTIDKVNGKTTLKYRAIIQNVYGLEFTVSQELTQ